MRDCGAHHAPGITIKSSGSLLPLNASRIKPRSTTAGGKKAGEEVREEDEEKGGDSAAVPGGTEGRRSSY